MLELNRVSRDICFFGSKGSGKTLGMTFYGLRAYLGGLNVYSNYDLMFPHIRLNSLSDIFNAKEGILLLDDLEQWLSSRQWKSKESQQVMQIILQGGKRSLTCLYSCKRPENVDVLLRDTTDFWCRCSLVPKETPKDGFVIDGHYYLLDVDSFSKWCQYLENLLLKIEIFDDSVNPVNVSYLGDLQYYAPLYSTKEEIEKLSFDEEIEGDS